MKSLRYYLTRVPPIIRGSEATFEKNPKLASVCLIISIGLLVVLFI